VRSGLFECCIDVWHLINAEVRFEVLMVMNMNMAAFWNVPEVFVTKLNIFKNMTIFNVIDFIITGCVHSLVMWV
jgi:hypothetical protein